MFTDGERLAYGHGDLHLPVGWGDIPWDALMAECTFPEGVLFNIELKPALLVRRARDGRRHQGDGRDGAGRRALGRGLRRLKAAGRARLLALSRGGTGWP